MEFMFFVALFLMIKEFVQTWLKNTVDQKKNYFETKFIKKKKIKSNNY